MYVAKCGGVCLPNVKFLLILYRAQNNTNTVSSTPNSCHSIYSIYYVTGICPRSLIRILVEINYKSQSAI